MTLSVSHPVSTRDTNIMPRVDTGCDTKRAISYYVYHILNHEKFLYYIMNCDVDVVT